MRFTYLLLFFTIIHNSVFSMLQIENIQAEEIKAFREQQEKDSFIITLTWASTEIQNSKNFKDTIAYLELIAEMFTKKRGIENKNNELDSISRLQKKTIRGYDISYENLRLYTINQGFETDVRVLRNEIIWNSEDEWEKNFRYEILKEILKRKINMYGKPPLSDDAIHQALHNATDRIHLDLIEGFSVPISILAVYRAYSIAPSYIIKAALTNHIVALAKKYFKNRLGAIAFIVISIAFWYAVPRIEKRYPKNVIYFYELIVLLLFDRKVIGVL